MDKPKTTPDVIWLTPLMISTFLLSGHRIKTWSYPRVYFLYWLLWPQFLWCRGRLQRLEIDLGAGRPVGATDGIFMYISPDRTSCRQDGIWRCNHINCSKSDECGDCQQRCSGTMRNFSYHSLRLHKFILTVFWRNTHLDVKVNEILLLFIVTHDCISLNDRRPHSFGELFNSN